MKLKLIAVLTAFLAALFANRASAQTLTTYLTGNGPNGDGYDASFTLGGSTLYATADSGGAHNHGTVFSFPVGGGSPTVLASFDASGGEGPNGNLTLIGSDLYGMTPFGGDDGVGTIFRVPTSGGAPTVLGSFNYTGGAIPRGGLTFIGSTLYGMTQNGGSNSQGVIFSIPISGGSPTPLFLFDGVRGSEPHGTLTLVGSTFYGMTQYGGANNDGTIFSIPVSGGSAATLFSFKISTGYNPVGSLTLIGSSLYGMTPNGGLNGDGTIFSIPVSGGTPTILASFNGSNGQAPDGDLTLVGSTLYGMTTRGGTSNDGVIFAVPVSGGVPITLISFNNSNGEFPTGSLTLVGSTLYGLTDGGIGTDGTIFSLTVGELNNGSGTADHSNNVNKFGPALISIVGPGGNYGGLSSFVQSTTGTGGGPMLGSTATILAGTDSGTFTGGATTVSMAWRTRTLAETTLAEGGKPASPPLPNSHTPLVSDVLQLIGLSSGLVDPSQTDPFTLQMTYNPSKLSSEAGDARLGAIYLAWLNPNGGGNGVPLWQNAILGNVGSNATFAEMNFQGSFAAFQTAVNDTNIADYVGAWGVDTANHDVWAVVNHDSQFAVVPEPSSLILLAIGVGVIWLVSAARRRRQLGTGTNSNGTERC